MSTMKIDLLIDNEDVATASYAEVRDPGRTADVVGLVAQAAPADVDRAVRAAQRAFASWRHTEPAERFALLQKAADLIDASSAELVPVVVAETGMLPAEIKMEFGGAALALRDNVEAALEFLKPAQYEDADSWVSVEKRPIGVIAAFIPWNAPIVLMIRKLAPALACGNTVVFKTPPTTPLGLGLLLKRIAALFPPGVINVLHGGAEVGAELAGHALVRKISFTGGGKAASAIMKTAADTIKGVQFELGGNDAAVVLDDADLEKIMPALVAGTFHRSGQFCFAIKRIYVPRAMYEDFFARMCAAVDRFKIGHPLDAQTTFGPVNNRGQFDYIAGLTARAKAAGARVAELGEVLHPEQWEQGLYLRPVIVADLAPDAELVVHEQFGPIVPLVPYDSEEQVIGYINDTEYGLGSSVWSSSFERATRFARHIEAGMTFINKNAQSRLGRRHMPFGGVKQSGVGTENSELGLAEYIEYHAINFHKNV